MDGKTEAYLEEPMEEKLKRMAKLVGELDSPLLLRLCIEVNRITELVIEMEYMLLSDELIRRKGKRENGQG
jgi:hypothetical protein